MLTIGYAILSKSGRVSDTPCIVFSITYYSDTKAKGITLYDDSLANTERLVLKSTVTADDTANLTFPGGLPLQYGMYITLDTEVTNCLVTYAIRQE